MTSCLILHRQSKKQRGRTNGYLDRLHTADLNTPPRTITVRPLRKMKKLFTILTALLLQCSVALPEVLQGRVVSVYDGDTVTVLEGTTQHKIRLEGIDAPESKQPWGTVSKTTLSQKVFGKDVEVRWDEKDRYGRTLGHIYINGEWVNLQMVKLGAAWHYKQYSKDKRLADAEDSAREAKIGLWRDAKPIPPWDWRKGVRGEEVRNIQPRGPPGVDSSSKVVYITNTGKKYHGPTCRFLAKSKYEITLQRAVASGYEPCKVCPKK